MNNIKHLFASLFLTLCLFASAVADPALNLPGYADLAQTPDSAGPMEPAVENRSGSRSESRSEEQSEEQSEQQSESESSKRDSFDTVKSTIVADEYVDPDPLPSMILMPFETLRVEADMDLKLVEVSGGEQLKLVYDLGDSDPTKFKAEVKRAEFRISQSYNARNISRISATLYYNSSLVNITLKRTTAHFETPYKSAIANIKLDDKASLTGEVNCADLQIDIDSESRLELTGRSEYLNLKAKSNSKIEIRTLENRSAEIEASHGAVVAYTTGDRMKATTSTGGTIKYWGEPTILRRTTKLIGGSLQKQN